MYNKSKNKILFVIFILVILLILFIFVLSVYNTKSTLETEEYKISPNNVLYDNQYNYISLEENSVLKKEWDGNYYLYETKKSIKHELGTEPVFYNKAKNQIIIYGNVHQVFSNGDTVEKKGKTVINNLSDFKFFKLNDRKYLIIGSDISNPEFYTSNYLLVSIDKAGNATLLNNNVNIKTINPLVLVSLDSKFDIANEKLIFGEEEIDLKKINGSTNEYIAKEETDEDKDVNETPEFENNPSQGGNNSNNNSGGGSKIYNEIINQIINISGLVNNVVNKTNLYKNISLRSVGIGASYLDVSYSIIDPENKYLSIFLLLEDENKNVNTYYLSKESTGYRISGLIPDKQYKLSICYIERSNSNTVVADSVMALTRTDPTSLRITKVSKSTTNDNNVAITYRVKMYNEYEFNEANVSLNDCEGTIIGENILNIQNALSKDGDVGQINLNSNYNKEYICLNLTSVKDINGNFINVNSYHKVKIK